jgi:hypothetical protein
MSGLACVVDNVLLVLLSSVLIIQLFNSHIFFINSFLLVSPQGVGCHILIYGILLLLEAFVSNWLGSLRPLLLNYSDVHRIVS